METLKRGILITIEGIDGSGKSTLAHALHQKFALDHPTLLTKEPGGTVLGKQLRGILQERTFALNPLAEYLLFAADRAQHFDELIIPALKENKIIISDRMADSSLVYQGYARGLSLDMIKSVNSWAMHSIKPDLTIYVEISVEESLERLKKRNEKLTAFEREKKSFTEKLVEGFSTIFKDRNNVILLDGRETPDTLTTQAYDRCTQWMKQHNHL